MSKSCFLRHACSNFCGAGSSKKKGHRALFFFSSPGATDSNPVRLFLSLCNSRPFSPFFLLLSNTFKLHARLAYINQNATILVRVYETHFYCHSFFELCSSNRPPFPPESRITTILTQVTLGWKDGWDGGMVLCVATGIGLLSCLREFLLLAETWLQPPPKTRKKKHTIAKNIA